MPSMLVFPAQKSRINRLCSPDIQMPSTRRQTTLKLVAGIAYSRLRCIPALVASSSRSSRLRIPIEASWLRNDASNCRLLSLVKSPFRLNGPYRQNLPSMGNKFPTSANMHFTASMLMMWDVLAEHTASNELPNAFGASTSISSGARTLASF